MNLKTIVNKGLLEPGTTIRPLMPNATVSATVNKDGKLIFGGHKFNDLNEAMSVVLDPAIYEQSTSTSWQFWGIFNPDIDSMIPLEHLRAKIVSSSNSPQVRTSKTHPLRIDSIQIQVAAGKISMTFCPGKKITGLYSGTWNRNLETDLLTIEKSGASMLITVMEDHEFSILGVPDFKNQLNTSRLNWLQLHIKDCNVPGKIFESEWKKVTADIHQRLKNNELIVIHCRGGLGRTGLLAARILVETGFTPVEAISMVRSTRSHTIETFAQEYYILTQAWIN